MPNPGLAAVTPVGLDGSDVSGVGECGRGGGCAERDVPGCGWEGGRVGRVVAVEAGRKQLGPENGATGVAATAAAERARRREQRSGYGWGGKWSRLR